MTKIKICGITNFEDARLAIDLGADMLGFNFYEKSPRYVSPAEATYIVRELYAGSIAPTVGVFVNENPDRLLRIATHLNIDVIQLHGDESPSYVKETRDRSGLSVIKAFRIPQDASLESIEEYHNLDGVLLDAYSPSVYGGSGEVTNWSFAKQASKRFPFVYLAGGLNPENVADAVREVQPFAVDVASGVELSPGKKDAKKLEAFIRNAKRA